VSITGWPFIGLLLFGAVALSFATVWQWKRLAAPGIRTVMARLALLATVQFLVLAATLAYTNRYFAFYTSWGDLFGTDRSHGKVVESRVGNVDPDKYALTEKVSGFSSGPTPSQDGKIESVDIKGARTGLEVPAYVFLPPQYFQPAYAAKKFPVVVNLTGYPGDAKALIQRLGVPRTALSEINAGKVQPTIYVMMRPTVDPPRDTECTDIPGGPQAATFFAQDLPEVIKAHYRASDNRSGWGFMGDSTGGYCSLKIVMTNSDRFAAAASMSGYYTALQDVTTQNLYGGSKALRNENDLLWRLQHLPLPPVAVMVTASKVGEKGYPSTEKFLQLAKAPMQVASDILPDGGHNFNTWRRVLIPCLEWLSQHLRP
jgi:enterochelin esterase-like enzyme